MNIDIENKYPVDPLIEEAFRISKFKGFMLRVISVLLFPLGWIVCTLAVFFFPLIGRIRGLKKRV